MRRWWWRTSWGWGYRACRRTERRKDGKLTEVNGAVPVNLPSFRPSVLPSFRLSVLLVPQRLHRIHPRRAVGGEHPEDQPDRDRDDRGEYRAPERHPRLQVEQPLDHLARRQADEDAEHPAGQRQGRGLDQELPQDFPPGNPVAV